MRRAAVLFISALALQSRALITNSLVGDWQGGVGATVSAGRVSQWNDQHNLLNNDGVTNNMTQGTASIQPLDYTDAQGFRAVMFPWAFSSAHPNTYLTIPNTLTNLQTTNLTVYVVATGPFDQERSETMLVFNGAASWINFFLDGAYPAYYPAGMVVGARFSVHPTIYAPLNRGVFVGSGSNVKTTTRWNNVTQTNLPQNLTTSSGGTLGINNGAPSGTEWGYCGVVYRVLIYRQAHTQAQMDAQVAELARLYNVLTNYTRQVVCRGDSIMEGIDSTNLQNCPFQLSERYPEIAWHNQGIGGTYIGNSNISDSMYAVDGHFVDALYDTNLQQNYLFFFGGANDVRSGGVSPIDTYTRLTNYVAARKAAHPWRVVSSTIHAIYGITNISASYNDCIRTNGGPWDRLVDPGMNSPIETRLNNPTDTNYYFYPGVSGDQGIHLINAGYGVLATHFGQAIDVQHRSTGFMAP
jgi:hypothetical protein